MDPSGARNRKRRMCGEKEGWENNREGKREGIRGREEQGDK